MSIANVTQFRSNFDQCKPFTTAGMQTILEASTALSWTVPGTADQKYRATFRCSSTAEIYVGYNVTATLPTSNTASNVSNVEFIPLYEPKYVRGGDVLSFISLTTPSIGVQLLQVEPNA